MIEAILKRDGSEEPFIPSKLNHWAEWACKGLEGRVDWSGIVQSVVKHLNGKVSSKILQQQLIDECIQKQDWPHNVMAGRLYVPDLRKKFYNNKIPTVQSLMNTMLDDHLVKQMSYSQKQWDSIETIIDHDRDFNMAHFQINQIVNKYAIRNRSTKRIYETPQFTMMRMALGLAEDLPKEKQLDLIERFYNHFSMSRVNAPTPNYLNLGTSHNGYASCCILVAGDDAMSISIANHITEVMTFMSAGIGGLLDTRSVGDSVRNGAIIHQGKVPYYAASGKITKSNLQAGRGGAKTEYFSGFDPEAETISNLQNEKATEDMKNRDLHFAMTTNKFFAKKVAKNEPVMTFNVKTAPDLHKKFYSADIDGFEALYNKYEQDPNFKKNYVDARKLVISNGQQSFEVGTNYLFFVDEANRHTPHKDPIRTSNLCTETGFPSAEYLNMEDLYSTEDHGRGEVGLCSLGGINVAVEMADEEYLDACYCTLLMIDRCIHMSTYRLPHVGFTAKQRLNAGIGVLGLATALARRGVKYSSDEGAAEIHKIYERHAYFCIKASLKLGKELGNAPWMHKTKWPEGWLPIDTYKKTVDEITPPVYYYDWEQLRAEVIANGGIRNSCLINHMPTESSSKASGAPNSCYPIRGLYMKKTDLDNAVDWVAIDSDLLADHYETAWEIDTLTMIKRYAIIQKFTDQGISIDRWRDRTVNSEVDSEEITTEYLHLVKYGNKSSYYRNTRSNKQAQETTNNAPDKGCGSGACTL
jgi:ribonucleoside-diphosphate reductase alpha chain